MNLVFALAIALISGCGLYLMLSRHVVRFILGLSILSAAVNLAILYSGRILSMAPPVIAPGETVLPETAANPLPQALILTAIVIGFALTAFVAALALQTWRSLGTLDTRALSEAEALGSPFEDDAERR